MVDGLLRAWLWVILFAVSGEALAQRVAPPILRTAPPGVGFPLRSISERDAVVRPFEVASATISAASSDAGSSRWSALRNFLYVETAIAALSSARYWDESGTKTLGGVLIFAGIVGYMGLTEGPCNATTPAVLQLVPAALVLVGGYDVFAGEKRQLTAREVFATNEIALNVIFLSGYLMSRNTPSLSPPCR